MRRTRHVLATFLLFAAVQVPALAQQAPATDRWEATIERFEAADREAAPAPGAVLFVGSSSIVRWASLVEDFPSIRTLNRGFGGSRISDVLQYADRIIVPYRPSHVVVYAGENDISGGRTGAEVFADYRALVEQIHAALPDTPITWITMKPSPSRWHLREEMQAGNRMVQALSDGDDRLGYIDVWDAMLGPDGTPREDLFVADMLHMNEAGYAIWRAIVAPHVE